MPRFSEIRITSTRAFVSMACALAAAPPVVAQSAAKPSAPFVVPAWAFPTSPAPSPAPVPDSVVQHRIPGSSRTYTKRQVGNAFDIPDWFPESHPPAPAPVLYGTRPAARACGYCHLPDGQGRPENGTLAGLPAEYIVKQVRAFRDSSRLAANPALATNSMHAVAAGTSDAEVAIAAEYFSKLKLMRPNHVKEVTRVPKTRVEIMLFAYDGEGTEPIDGRLIEVPASFERHELRDPTVEYTTYVPVGSIARGRQLATRGPSGATTVCATCHGPQLLGLNAVPPLAGRSPSNILRQLMNFRTRARHDSLSVAMTPVVQSLSVDDMVALSAYMGSLPPNNAPRTRARP